MNLKIMEVTSTIDHLSREQVEKGVTYSRVSDYVYILHDKDYYTKEDEEKNANHKAGTKKPAHWHVYLKLKDSTPIEHVAAAFCVSANFVCKIHKGWNFALLYVTHLNAPEKAQYDDSEAVSSYDWVAERDRLNKDRKKEDKILSSIIEKIDSGELREYNLTDYVSMKDYVKYERAIKKAFDYRAQRIAERKVL